MFKRLLLGLLLVAVLLSGVSLATAQLVTEVPFEDATWCYQFNFKTNSHQAFVGIGEWTATRGFESAVTNGVSALAVQITLPQTISLLGATWRIERNVLGLGSINVQASLDAFGIEHVPDPLLFTIGSDLDPEQTYQDITVERNSADDFGSTATMSVSASNGVAMTLLTVYGNGINPFPFNHCGDSTPTPSPTPTGTLPPPTHDGSCLLPGEPSPTPSSPSATPGPSPTPSFGGQTWDFSSDTPPSPWSASNWSAITANQGTVGGGVLNSSTTDFCNECSPNKYFINAARRIDFPADVYVDAVSFYVSGNAFSITLNMTYYVYLLDASGSVLQTLSGSATENVTPALKSFNTNESLAVRSVVVINHFARESSFSGSISLDDVYINWAYVQTPDPTPTPWPECTLTPTITPSISPTPTLTRTPTLSPTPFTLTPTLTRTPTRTQIPVILPTTFSTSTPRPPTATAHPSLTPAATATVIMPSASGTPLAGGGIGQPRPFDLVGDISFTWENINAVAGNVWARGRGWATGFGDRVSGLSSAWSEAPATAPPQMWDCIEEPYESQWCAILYFLQFTVLSGTIGSLIVPVGTLLIFLFGAFVFVKIFRAFLARTQEMLNV